jgi:hypothetical protein
MKDDLAKLFAAMAEGCYRAADAYRAEYSATGLRGADMMASRLCADGDRNWQKANALRPDLYPMVAS